MRSIDLSPRLLQQYVVLAEEKHFGRAAGRLHISQPSLSQAISRLEQLLDVELLSRTSRTVELTPAGAAFANDAQGVIEAQYAAITRARRIARGEEGELQLGTVTTYTYSLIPGLVRLSRRELPNLRIRVQNSTSMELVDRVRTGRVDVALVAGPLPDSAGLTVSTVYVERISVVLPANHRLAGQEAIRLSDLADDDFAVLSEPGHAGLLSLAGAACAAAGFTPREVASADTVVGLIGQVASGTCVSFAPEQMHRWAPPGVVFKPVERVHGGATDPTEILKAQIVAVVRTDHDPSITKFLRLLNDPSTFELPPSQ